MNLTKKTILAVAGLTLATAGFAQSAAITPAPVGLLGQSYSEASFSVTDIRHYSKNQYGLGIGANVPVTPHFDLTGSYDYSWLRGLGHTNGLTGGATAYTQFNGVKPFVGAAVGYQWDRYAGYRDSDWSWGLATGVEIPAGIISLTPRIVYSDDFRGRESRQQWAYGVEANYWVTRTASVFAAVDYVDVKATNDDAWSYTIGARFKF